jgi:hypothetical protein
MKARSTLTAAIFISAAITGGVVAQTAAGTSPSKATTAAKPISAEKQAVSKACSDQADSKGLHGKERKKFRSECKKKGGKAS